MTKKQTEANNTAKLAEEVTAAEQTLHEKRAQKTALEKQLQEAVQAGNVESAKNLRQQLAELDASIVEGEDRLLRLGTARREAELPAAEAERERLMQAAAGLRAKYDALRTELEQTDFAFNAVDQHVRSLQATIADRKRQIAAQDRQRARMAERVANPPTLAWRR